MTDNNCAQSNRGPQDEALMEEATAWFVRMRADDLTEAERSAFQAWLERDAAHGRAYAEAEALWQELGGIPDPRSAPAPVAQARPRATRARMADPARPRPRARRRAPAAVAASLLVAGVAGFWSSGGLDRLRADHVTAVGATREISLADGSTAHLNTDSALAVDFTERCRCLRLLRGEAFFTVTRDVDRPFRVAAGTGRAEALGTAFNVHDSGRQVTVAVSEGRVRVSRAGEPATGLTLAAGESARYAATGAVERADVDVARRTAWREGRIVFADRPLREVVAELDRYRPGAIVVLDSAIADERFTGVVTLQNTDRALAALEATLPVNVVRLTPWLTLLRAGG